MRANYLPPLRALPGADTYPGLAVDDGRLGTDTPRVLTEAEGADVLALLLGELYPNMEGIRS